jgi:hypothetical protein
MSDINWQNLRPWAGSQPSAFEELCTQLAAYEPPPGDAIFVRKGAPDAGLECYWRDSAGDESGWQAKFFLGAVDDSRWAQVDESVRRAIDRHPRLIRMTICFPRDREDPRTPGRTSTMEAWNVHVDKWSRWAKDNGRSITFPFWGEHELLERLTRQEHEGRYFYWFNAPLFARSWFESRLDETIAKAGPRYTPEVNVQLAVARLFDGLRRAPAFTRRFDDHVRRIRRDARYLRGPHPSEVADDLIGFDTRVENLCRQTLIVTDGGIAAIPFDSIAASAAELRDDAWNLHQRCRSLPVTNPNAGSDPRPYHLSQMAAALHDLHDDAMRPEARLANIPALLLRGDAGTGKTHLLCDVAKRAVADGHGAIVLLGEGFAEHRDPWVQILEKLGLSSTRDQFLGALNTMGETTGVRVMLLIDALNESQSTSLWRRELSGMLTLLRAYPRVGFAVTVRSSYEDDVAGPGRDDSVLLRQTHYGFDDEYEAAKTFFHYYGLQSPAVPLLNPEFQNPLFLKVICSGLKAAGYTSFPAGFQGITTVFNFMLDAVNAKLSKELDFDPTLNPVRDAVVAIVDEMTVARQDWVPRDRARVVVDAVLPRNGWERTLFRRMIAEGILTVDRFPLKGSYVDGVRFAYERLSDHMVVDRLVSPFTGSVTDAGQLGSLEEETRRFCDEWRRGRLEALAIQLPERIGLELPDLVPNRAGHELIHRAMVNSISWRRHQAFSERTRKFINEIAATPDGLANVLDAMLSVTATPGHPFNAEALDHILRKYSLPDRDAWWSTYLYEQYNEHGAVDRLVAWAWAEESKDHIEDDAVLLAGIALAWFLTTSHRYLRDRATKALVRLFTPRLPLLGALLRRFHDVDDIYVQERLYAVAYGAAMRSTDRAAVDLLARQIDHDIFATGAPPPHVLLRDYARGVIECAVMRGMEIDAAALQRIRPPYKSDFPAIPDEASIKQFDIRGEDRGDLRWAQWEIFQSVMSFGDFARYIIGTNSQNFAWTGQRLRGKRPPTPKQQYRGFLATLTARQRKAFDDFEKAYKEHSPRLEIVPPVDGSDTVTFRTKVHAGALSAEKSLRKTLGKAKTAAFEAEVLPFLRTPREKPPKFDLAGAQRWILKRVFNLGWTIERFGRFDRSHTMRQNAGRSANKPERMGKKYQWLAWHEFVARVADNFRFSDFMESSKFEGPWQKHIRDIDPSLLLRSSLSENWTGHSQTWWFPLAYEHWWYPEDDRAWIGRVDDLPDAQQLIEVLAPDGGRALVLDTFVEWQSPTPPGVDGSDVPRREIVYAINSCIIRTSDLPGFISWGNRHNFWGNWLESEQLYRVYLGEFHWAPAYRYEMRHERRRGWTRGNGALPGSVLPTSELYVREHGTFDCSIDNSVILRLPSRWLAEEMGVRSNGVDGCWFMPNGSRAFEDPTARETGASALVADREILSRFLLKTGHTTIWAVGGERRILYPMGDSNPLQSVEVTGFYWFDGKRVSGSIRAVHTDRS